LFLVAALAVGTGISEVVAHEYGRGSGLIAVGLLLLVPTALMRWYPQALSFGSTDRTNTER
jgi:hypothetical protein